MTTSAKNTAYRFGSFVLDLQRGALLAQNGVERPLRPKSFALLKLLVENAGRLLSQDVIMEALWPTVCVTENNVTQCIHDIRSALSPEGQRLVRTRPRRGYLFTPDATAFPPSVSSRDEDETNHTGLTLQRQPNDRDDGPPAALDGSIRQQLSPPALSLRESEQRFFLTVAPW